MANDERGDRTPRRRRRRGSSPLAGPRIEPDGRPRPLLGGGERLAHKVTRAPGGAPGWNPRSFDEAAALLAPKARRVAEEVRQLPEPLRATHVVIEAKVLPNYLAGSHYPDTLLRTASLYPVGTRQSRGTYYTPKRPPRENEPTKTYLLAGDDDAVDRLADLIDRGPTAGLTQLWKDIRELDEIQLPQPETVLRGIPEDTGAGEIVTWEAVLTGLGASAGERERYTAEVLEKFIAYVETLRGEVDRAFIRRVDGLTFLPVALTAEDAPEAARFNALRTIRPMPRVRDMEILFRGADIGGVGANAAARETASVAAASAAPRGSQAALPAQAAPAAAGSAPVRPADTGSPGSAEAADGTEPIPALTSERVAVFDGGVDMSDPMVAPYVRLHQLPGVRSVDQSVRHGTIVTNAVLYGYEAAAATPPAPLVTIDHYQVLWPPPSTGSLDTQLIWIIDEIERITVAEGHKLVNLSVGPPRCVDEDGDPDSWTARLDKLAHEHGILFTCAAGNVRTGSNNRIYVPGDMANGLAVGACVSRDPSHPVQRAGYSRVGPGRAGQRVAPMGVAFGGSKAAGDPFLGRGPGGVVSPAEGTSCATPLVTHGLAELRAIIGGSPRPDMLRAFAAHFAEGQPAPGQDERDIGHGRFRESYAGVWDCGPNSVTALYDLSLVRNQVVAIPFPMPTGVRDDAEIRVVWTVCYSSVVQAQHASEYTCAGLELTFRPHDRIYTLSDVSTAARKKIKDFDIERDSEELAAYFASGQVQLSRHPVSMGGWRRSRWEGDQRDEGKWDTLVRAERVLSADKLHGPRLDIEYLAREGSRLLRANVRNLPVTVLVTLTAPADVPLYDTVRQQLPLLTTIVPGTVSVPVRTTA